MARKLKPTKDMQSSPDKAEKRGARSRPSNVSDDTLAKHYQIVLAAKLDEERAAESLKSARGILGAKIKDAQAAGVNVKAMKVVLGWRKRETSELDQEIRSINRIAFIANLPIGAQLGLFENGESVAKALDDKAIVSSADLDEADARGFDAGHKGHGANLNPHDEGSPLALRWEAGRQRATVERAGEVFNGSPEADLAGDIATMNALRATATSSAVDGGAS